MSLRETITSKPASGLIAAGAMFLVAIVLILFQLGGHGAPAPQDEAFFSIDDGKTWFTDSAKKIPPFDKDGKQAVRAYVYRGTDGKEFVNHLERFKPDAKRALETPHPTDPNQKVSANLAMVQSAYTSGREVKRPGDPTWVGAANFKAASQAVTIKTPSGGTEATPVEP